MEGFFDELVGDLLMHLIRVPGAFVRWIFTGFRKPYLELLKDDGFLNGVIGLGIVATITVVLVVIL